MMLLHAIPKEVTIFQKLFWVTPNIRCLYGCNFDGGNQHDCARRFFNGFNAMYCECNEGRCNSYWDRGEYHYFNTEDAINDPMRRIVGYIDRCIMCFNGNHPRAGEFV